MKKCHCDVKGRGEVSRVVYTMEPLSLGYRCTSQMYMTFTLSYFLNFYLNATSLDPIQHFYITYPSGITHKLCLKIENAENLTK